MTPSFLRLSGTPYVLVFRGYGRRDGGHLAQSVRSGAGDGRLQASRALRNYGVTDSGLNKQVVDELINLIKKWILHLIGSVFFGGKYGLDNADVALRYLPISDYILHGDIKDPKILEVGSGVKGITPYIPFKITGADVSFDGEIAENLEPVLLSGERLPFHDNSFDYVISVDMLEHVPENERPGVITELLRVATKRVFLAVPCGKLAESHDRFLDELYLLVKGERYHFFQEHVDNGLPVKEDLLACIKAASEKLGISVDIKVIGNVSLKVRTFFMRVWITAKTAKLYTWISPFLCIFSRFLNNGECYRQIFVIDIVRGE